MEVAGPIEQSEELELEQWQRSYSCVGETLRQLLHAGWNVHIHTLQHHHEQRDSDVDTTSPQAPADVASTSPAREVDDMTRGGERPYCVANSDESNMMGQAHYGDEVTGVGPLLCPGVGGVGQQYGHAAPPVTPLTVPTNTPVTVSRQCSTEINTSTSDMTTTVLNGEQLEQCLLDMLNDVDLSIGYDHQHGDDAGGDAGLNASDCDCTNTGPDGVICMGHDVVLQQDKDEDMMDIEADMTSQDLVVPDDVTPTTSITTSVEQFQEQSEEQSMDVDPCDNELSSQGTADTSRTDHDEPSPPSDSHISDAQTSHTNHSTSSSPSIPQVPTFRSHAAGQFLQQVPSNSVLHPTTPSMSTHPGTTHPRSASQPTEQTTPQSSAQTSLAPYVNLTQMFSQLLTSFYFEVFLWMYGNILLHPRSSITRTRLRYLGQITGQSLEDITRNVLLGYFHGFHQGRTAVFQEICTVLRSVNHGAGGVTVDAAQSRWLRELSIQMGVHLNSRQMLRSFSVVVADLVNNQRQPPANATPPNQTLIWLASQRRNRLVQCSNFLITN